MLKWPLLPVIPPCTGSSLSAQLFGTFIMLATHFSEQWKWSMELAANRGAEASQGSGCPSDSEDELQSCLYHRWLISASDFPFQRPGTVTVSHHYSHLRVVVCVCVCGWLVCDMQQVNVSMFVWCFGLCMSTWKLDGTQCVHPWRRCWRCTAWNRAGIWYGEKQWGRADTLSPVICRLDHAESVWLHAGKDSEQSPSVRISPFGVLVYSGTRSHLELSSVADMHFFLNLHFFWSS